MHWATVVFPLLHINHMQFAAVIQQSQHNLYIQEVSAIFKKLSSLCIEFSLLHCINNLVTSLKLQQSN